MLCVRVVFEFKNQGVTYCRVLYLCKVAPYLKFGGSLFEIRTVLKNDSVWKLIRDSSSTMVLFRVVILSVSWQRDNLKDSYHREASTSSLPCRFNAHGASFLMMKVRSTFAERYFRSRSVVLRKKMMFWLQMNGIYWLKGASLVLDSAPNLQNFQQEHYKWVSRHSKNAQFTNLLKVKQFPTRQLSRQFIQNMVEASSFRCIHEKTEENGQLGTEIDQLLSFLSHFVFPKHVYNFRFICQCSIGIRSCSKASCTS